MNSSEEKILRENIRQMISVVKERKAAKPLIEEKKLKDIIRKLADVESHQMNEEQRLRNIIRKFIQAELTMITESGIPDDKPTPNKSTGINVLEDLLKKIIPVLEMDFRQLTTNTEQRKSFRAHVVNAVINTLTPVEINTAAGDAEAEEIEEAVTLDIEEPDDEKFIDIRSDSEKSAEEEEEEEADPKEEFGAGLEDSDETGRNMAFQSFNKIEGSIVDSYELLSNAEDQELFYDYLIANLKLYFDKFESELSATVEEPTNKAYDDAKEDVQDLGAPEGAEEEMPALEETIVWDI